MSSTDSQPKQVVRRHARRWRWRPQFGLRTLLVGSLMIGVVLAKLPKAALDASQQREVIEKVALLGGSVQITVNDSHWARNFREWLGSEYFDTIEQVNLNSTGATDEDVIAILQVTDLTSLNLSGTQVTDAVLPKLADETRLEELGLRRTGVTDDGLEHLVRMASLKHLRLSGPEITDRGLAVIAKIKNLKVLVLGRTRITASGLAVLRGHSRLTELRLLNAVFSGPGLFVLAELPELRILDLDFASFNVADMAQLATLHQVEEFSFAGGSLTDEDILQFAAIRPRTSLTLHLPNAEQLTKAGLLHLKTVPNLHVVTLYNDRLSDSDFDELRKELPFCTINR